MSYVDKIKSCDCVYMYNDNVYIPLRKIICLYHAQVAGQIYWSYWWQNVNVAVTIMY